MCESTADDEAVELERRIRASLGRRADLAAGVALADIAVAKLRPERSHLRPLLLVAALVGLIGVGVGLANAVRDDSVRVIDPAESSTTAPMGEASPLVIPTPTGAQWRRSIPDAVSTTQRFTHPRWPVGVEAMISEFDTSLGPLGDLAQYPVDLVAGERTLRRRAPSAGNGERLWLEPDGRAWTVALGGGPGPDWDETTWRRELVSLVASLRYLRGSFSLAAPYRALPPGGTWEAGSWRERVMRWQVGDGRHMITAYLDDAIAIADLPGRAVTVRGHPAKLGREALVWREDADTFVVLGNSIRAFDGVSIADLQGRSFAGELGADTAVRVANSLRPVSLEEYGELPVWFGTSTEPRVILRTPAWNVPLWVVMENQSGERRSTAAPGVDGGDLAGIPVGDDRPVRVWLAESPFGGSGAPPPDCATTIVPPLQPPPLAVRLDPSCVVRRP